MNAEQGGFLRLALELVTASLHSEPEAHALYVNDRLSEELETHGDAHSLITLLTFIAGDVVAAWAEDTGRDPAAMLQVIALEVAQVFDGGGA